jgi:hypothetical protein
MSYRSELHSYIAQLQQRLRLAAWLQGAAIFTGTALAVTVALVLALNHFAFPTQAVTFSRILMLAALAAAAIFGLALPLRRLTQARAARIAEAQNPALEQRLTTFEERTRRADNTLIDHTFTDDPFLELLAADTLACTGSTEPQAIVSGNRLFALGGAGFACLAVLLWMIAAGPGYLGYGASLLWTGPGSHSTPLYAIAIQPGNVTVRRNGDQLITAHVTGMQPARAQLFAHYQSSAGWEPVAMQRTPDSASGATYQFVLAGLPESVEYYVGAGPLVSSHYKIKVVDLPSIKDIHVTYQYPTWTGMKPATEEHSGDLRAIEGTDASIQIETDRPLIDGKLSLDGGQTIALSQVQGNIYRGSIHMEKDGAYHLAASDEGQAVRLSEDYFIATDKALPPEIAIARPRGDYRASPIEEVTVGVKGTGSFGLREMHLHYTVNGGQDHDISLLKTPGAKDADGSYTLPLEDFKLAPGDLISLYATAKDGHSESRTDISFIQVDPFEREFSQSQQSGGGGGGGSQSGDQTEISKREKELIAATWKQQNDKTVTPASAAAQGEFLSQAQQKLRDQVNALSARMQSRDISEANQEFTDLDRDMRAAAQAMVPSAEKLKGTQWKDALQLEQKALQALLRAEATFRQIQVAFGQQGGGGGGGGNSGRDLASLFDLELDTAKNQYETAQTASPAEQHEKDVEDMLAKLDALAKRQEELANRQPDPQQSFQERWQQEMLRREAEQLQRQMEQLARNNQQGASQSSQQSGQQSSQPSQQSGQPGQTSQQGQSSQSASQQNSSTSQSSSSSRQSSGSPSPSQSAQSSDQRIEQALSRLQQASGMMKRGDAPGQTQNAQQAAQQLRQASNLLAGTQQQMASSKVDSLAGEADRIRQEERAQADRINQFAAHQNDAAPGSNDLQSMLDRRNQLAQLSQERQQLSDRLSALQRNLRNAAHDLASNQPGAAQTLRDALKEMDDSDLDNRVQRTADWLRRGVNPATNGTEDEIAKGLGRLSQQLQQAQKSAAASKQGQRATDQDRASLVDQVERLRNQIESMTAGNRAPASRAGNRQGQASPGARPNQPGQPGQGNQPGQQRFSQADPLTRGGSQPGQSARLDGQPGQPNQSGQASSGNQPGGSRAQSGGANAPAGGDLGNRIASAANGEVRTGGGRAADGTAWNNINTGNNRYGDPRRQPGPPDSPDSPPTQQSFAQGMRELNQLRQMLKNDPQAEKEIADLTRQMQNLSPDRFPGNPAMVEQMHREILSSVNRLELQLQKDGVSPDARTGNPAEIPAGYRDSVADYYRRLSKNP